jgi:glycolate oxidase
MDEALRRIVGCGAGGGVGSDAFGPDLIGLICGTEGTLGLVTKVWCRLTPKPVAFRTAVAIFDTAHDACQAVADIIAAGIVPAALEMMDGPLIACVNEVFGLGFPKDAQSLLLIEVDGQDLGLDDDLARIEAFCTQNRASSFQGGRDPARRAQLWTARKRAFGAIGRITPNYCTQDACVPRSKLPDVLAKVAEICARYKLRITNVFHAGDGNLHPAIFYDERDPDSARRTLAAAAEILHYCVSIGGTVTGEHGVGIEKLGHLREMFSAADLESMHRIRGAFSPGDLMNPFKTLPREGGEIDLFHPTRPGRRAPH